MHQPAEHDDVDNELFPACTTDRADTTYTDEYGVT